MTLTGRTLIKTILHECHDSILSEQISEDRTIERVKTVTTMAIPSLDFHMAYQATVLYGQLAISITSGQYGHFIILWTIYGHLSFGAFMALHLNPEAIAAIYAQLGISGHFPQNQGKWPKFLFLVIWAHNAHLHIFAHFAHFDAKCPKDTFLPFGPVFGSEPKSGQKPQRTQKHLSKL
ncbi:hypothetical protein O181_035756 [Austropuccinia psidii MF-1]|uniref:Uncharacterized protein n=1 Tax=Austropuccinia psidii MF-1 TaxID=1389203 RepID=A0A9Q3D8V9_9BASI|nr:hypothetical protein [Austropuccinia psidii MF-1]